MASLGQGDYQIIIDFANAAHQKRTSWGRLRCSMRTVEIIARASDSMNSACPTERSVHSFCEIALRHPQGAEHPTPCDIR